jgi:uncharacterized protein YkwD
VQRASLSRLLLVLVLACLAPVGALAATGLADSPDADSTETAAGGSGRTDPRGLTERSDTTGRSSSTTGRSSTTTSTSTSTSTTAPPTTPPPTEPPTTEPPTTEPPTTAPPTSGSPPPPSATDQVVSLVNAARADADCGALRVDDRLTAAAQAHSDDMAVNGYFSHTSQDGRTFADRVHAAGYPDPGGENIAQGQRSAQSVHDAWMSSEGHRDNILNCSFTAIGVGLNTSAWTWTQNFGY